jgi:Uma2 family endonuclease
MTTASHPTASRSPLGEPAWDVAQLFPAQGQWSVQEYLSLNGNHLVEFSDGYIEVLPVPTMRHQVIAKFLLLLLTDFVDRTGKGKTLMAPLRIRLWADKFREPDLVVMLAGHEQRMGDEFWDGADFVVEVVSDDDRRRDLETKRVEYARAGIPEYWIVDPQENAITVLTLDGDSYAVHGQFRAGQRAASVLLPGFSVAVDDVFAAR